MKKLKGIWLLTVLLIFFPAQVKAGDGRDLQTLQLFFENDLFSDTDKYYTNAVQMTWLSKELESYVQDVRLPPWTLPVIEKFPFVNEPDSHHNVGLILGQHIYTPADIRVTGLIKDDRPYAGFLYAGIALHSKTRFQLDTIEAVFGVVGPASLAAKSQNTVHRIRNIEQALGWDNQLHDEFAARISWQRKWRFWRWDHEERFLCADMITHAGATLGNVRTGVSTGIELRAGINIPQDFGSDVIRPGAGISAPMMRQDRHVPFRWGIHGFAGTQVEFVARDIFLDGNTWSFSHSVPKKQLVADLSVGVAFNYETVKLTYRHVFRTRQFSYQEKGHTIGSLTLTWSF